jgi:hypothetical protein
MDFLLAEGVGELENVILLLGEQHIESQGRNRFAHLELWFLNISLQNIGNLDKQHSQG